MLAQNINDLSARVDRAMARNNDGVAAFGAQNDEEIPPYGSPTSVYNGAQIRYCLSQKIRIGAWEGSVDTQSEVSVGEFNSAVGDYNQRCGHFRYRTRDYSPAAAQVESRRSDLVRQGLYLAGKNF